MTRQLVYQVYRFASQILAEDAPDPGTGSAPPGGVGRAITEILGWLAWGVSAACVAGLLITAGRMAMSHRKGEEVDVAGLGKVLGACALLAAAGPMVNFIIAAANEEE